MFNFLRKTALWIVAVPVLAFYLGQVLNQTVLVANHDRFPVMWNEYRVAAYTLQIEKAASGEDAEAAQKAKFDLVALDSGYLDDTHVIMTSNTHLNFLADWINLQTETISPGDMLLELGRLGMKYAPFVWALVVVGKLRKQEDRY